MMPEMRRNLRSIDETKALERKAEYEKVVPELMGLRSLYQAECIHCGMTITGRSRHEILKAAYGHLRRCEKRNVRGLQPRAVARPGRKSQQCHS
jgi:hypothetical protein